MKKAFILLLGLVPSLLFAQLYNDQVFVVSGGVFEFSPPFADYVRIHRYHPITRTLEPVDQIGSQSTQGALIAEDTLYVLTSDSIVAYQTQTGQRLAATRFPGASPSPGSIAHAPNGRLLVGNWYGQTDSNLYFFNTGNLTLTQAVTGMTRQTRGIAIWQDTAYVAQNIPGTIDECPPFGCYSDSIGQLAMININTGLKFDELTFSATEGGMDQLFMQNGILYTINNTGESISRFQTADRTIASWTIPGDVGRGIVLQDSLLHLEVNGQAAIWNTQSQTLMSSALSVFAYPAAIGYDPGAQLYYETTTDFSSYGRLYQTQSVILDSVETGIAPEAIALHYRMNYPPVAQDDSVQIIYTQDTIVNVLANDADETLKTFAVRIIDSFDVVGSQAFVDSQQSIHLFPAAGIETTDTLRYEVCDGLGGCDTARLTLKTTGFDGIPLTTADRLLVYPNPFQDKIYILSSVAIDRWRLFHSNGQLIQEGSENPGMITVTESASGLYILQIDNPKGRQYSKLSRIH
jgi:hypothetical protein